MLLTGRRELLASLAGGGILLHFAFAHAVTLTGIDVLDTSAVRVRNPAGVLLEAVTLIGNRLVAVGEHGVIIYSDNNGMTWTQASVPVDVTLTCIGFATPKVGWAAGHFGVILNTTDGGLTWTTQLNGIQVNQLTLVAAQAESGTAPGAPRAMRRAEIFLAAGPSKPFLSLLAISSQEAIVFGAYRMTMRTVDGGKSWVDWSLQIGDPVSHNLYAVASDGASLYLVAETGLVFRSDVDGDKFTQVASPADVTLLGVVCATDGSVIVFGVAGSCFRSTDGGKTWTPINLQTQDNLSSGILARSGKILIASQTGLLYISHDNGATFKSIPGLPPTSIFGMAEASDDSIIFVGSSGVMKQPMAMLGL